MNSTCFGQFLCPSSGVFHCTHSNGICLLTASCQQTCMTYTIAVYRVHSKNKFEKSVHLVGFYHTNQCTKLNKVLCEQQKVTILTTDCPYRKTVPFPSASSSLRTTSELVIFRKTTDYKNKVTNGTLIQLSIRVFCGCRKSWKTRVPATLS